MSTSTAWARSFFTGLFVDLWLAATTPEQTRTEADFLEKALALAPGSRVLDLCCGGGRHAIELAARGHRPTGVDLSPEFLAAARRSAAERGVQVALEERAIGDLPWDGQFDAAYCLGNSLGGLEDDELLAALRATCRALRPGGRLVIETGTIAESLLPALKDSFWMPVGDILFLVHNSYDAPRSRLNMDFTLIRGEQVEKKSGFQLVYTCREFSTRLAEAGFNDLATYGSTALEPYGLGSPQFFIVGTRTA